MGQILITVIILFLLWDAAWWVVGVKALFPWRLRDRLEADAPDLVLLDVRTPGEYNWFHLPGAQNLPDLLADSAKMPPVSPSQDVVVICMTGHRSSLVAHALKKRGYSRVYNLTWGMVGWKVYGWISLVKGRLSPPTPRN